MRRLRVQFRKGNGQPRVCSQMKIQMKQDLYVDAYDPLLARVDDAITYYFPLFSPSLPEKWVGGYHRNVFYRGQQRLTQRCMPYLRV